MLEWMQKQLSHLGLGCYESPYTARQWGEYVTP